MHRAIVLLALFALAACQGHGSGEVVAPLTADLFPFDAAQVAFRYVDGGERSVEVVPAPDGTTVELYVRGVGEGEQRLTARRVEDGIFVSNGPGRGTELVRLGARPGDTWTTAADTVRFDGWERVTVPAGTYDAARITLRRGSETLQRVESWWLAPGVGIVRIMTDRAGLVVTDLQRTSP